MHFVKLDATGNDFVALDLRNRGPNVELPTPQQMELWCNRKRGVGSDGVLVLRDAEEPAVAYALDFFNPDGSAAFCGNGSRAAFWWARTMGASAQLVFRAIDGLHRADAGGPFGCSVSVRCEGTPRATPHGQYIVAGTHHLVILVDTLEEVLSCDLPTLARPLRHHADFSPLGVNVNIASMERDVHGFRAMRTYEKGVECETLSCGSGAVAVMQALRVANDDSEEGPERLRAPGGELQITIDPEGVTWLSGAVCMPFKGEFTQA